MSIPGDHVLRPQLKDRPCRSERDPHEVARHVQAFVEELCIAVQDSALRVLCFDETQA